ncbi:MAG: hypothetical protein H6675_02180 [Dehalococcoidia bacterium]|nr:hypothetical protein [Dehalococcoidia bacterium]
MNATKLAWTRSAALTGVTVGVLVGSMLVGLLAAQPAHAAELGAEGVPAVLEEQTAPEPADPASPGDVPGEGATNDAVPDGETAVADGGSATPWVIAGIGAVLILAIAAVAWSGRKPRRMDLERGAHDLPDARTSEHRYIPPGL